MTARSLGRAGAYSMRTMMLSSVAWVAILAASAWGSIVLRQSLHVYDHFDVVKPGLFYRSGELRPEQVTEVVARYDIKTIVNLQMPTEDSERERLEARRLGIDFLNLPMPGDGFGREEQFRQVLEAINDPERRPVLVHCARGTCRTGAAVALYRFESDGWTIEDVTAEMVRQTYRDGYLPGYVFAMVRNRPYAELFRTERVYDRNRADATSPAADDETTMPEAVEPPDLETANEPAEPSSR